jgi:hypothetical protein
MLYFFVLAVPFVLVALTVIGLPALAVLRKLNAMTTVWIACVALAFSLVIGTWTLLSPYNLWCSSHLIKCGAESVLSTALFAIPVAIGFALSAKIPFRRHADAV